MDDKKLDQIIDGRLAELNSKSQDAKRKGDDKEMFKLNTAWHWLDAIKRDIEATRS